MALLFSLIVINIHPFFLKLQCCPMCPTSLNNSSDQVDHASSIDSMLQDEMMEINTQLIQNQAEARINQLMGCKDNIPSMNVNNISITSPDGVGNPAINLLPLRRHYLARSRYLSLSLCSLEVSTKKLWTVQHRV